MTNFFSSGPLSAYLLLPMLSDIHNEQSIFETTCVFFARIYDNQELALWWFPASTTGYTINILVESLKTKHQTVKQWSYSLTACSFIKC